MLSWPTTRPATTAASSTPVSTIVPDSHKARFCVGGKQALIEFCDENEIEYERCGKVIVATNEAEVGRLHNLYERGTANGVEGLEMVGPERLKEIEPHVAGIRALWAPTTGIIDYRKVASAYAGKFEQAGGDIFTSSPVQRVVQTQDGLALETPKGIIETQPRHKLRRSARRQGRQDDGRGRRHPDSPVPGGVLHPEA